MLHKMLKTISEQIQLGDAGSDQYQGSTDETKQVVNQDGDNNDTAQESSNTETQVQVGTEMMFKFKIQTL